MIVCGPESDPLQSPVVAEQLALLEVSLKDGGMLFSELPPLADKLICALAMVFGPTVTSCR